MAIWVAGSLSTSPGLPIADRGDDCSFTTGFLSPTHFTWISFSSTERQPVSHFSSAANNEGPTLVAAESQQVTLDTPDSSPKMNVKLVFLSLVAISPHCSKKPFSSTSVCLCAHLAEQALPLCSPLPSLGLLATYAASSAATQPCLLHERYTRIRTLNQNANCIPKTTSLHAHHPDDVPW